MERTEQLSVRVSASLKAALIRAAKADDRSLASFVEKVLREALANTEKPK